MKIVFALIFMPLISAAQEAEKPYFPAPTGLRVEFITVDEEEVPKEKKKWNPDKRYIEISHQGLTNFYFGREDLQGAENKLTASGRYVWSEVIKIQKTWEKSDKGQYLQARVLFGNTNFGDTTFGIQGGFGWCTDYIQAGIFLGLQHRGEQYYLNEFKFNPKNPPPANPQPAGGTTKFVSPLPENPLVGGELNFRIPLTEKIRLKINNVILPGITTHGLGLEYNY